jgi:hypothetical protein
MGKTLRQAYLDAPKTWPLWARRSTAPDYKQIKRTALSEAPDLTQVKAGKGIVYGTLGEGREVYALADYNGGIRLTRQAIVNDDMDAFGRIPQLQSAAAARKEDDVVYGILQANADMADEVPLFDASDHGNLLGSGTVPWFLAAGTDQIDTVEIGFLEDEPGPVLREEVDFDTEDLKFAVRHTCAAKAIDHRGLFMNSGESITVTTVAAGRAAMRAQTGPKGKARLNLRPRFLLVGAANETVAEQLLASLVDPAKSTQTPNPFGPGSPGRLTLVVDPRVEE